MRFVAGNKTFEISRRPIIMGILNVTPDSFYDGGKYNSPDFALKHAEEMILSGADIIDVGGESTRPGSLPVSESEEIRRVVPVIENIVSKIPGAVVSIDTYKPAVARAAVSAGALLINDILAFRYKGISEDGDIILTSDDECGGMPDVARASGAGVILMHIKGTPRTMQKIPPEYSDVTSEIKDFLKARADAALRAGIPRENIAIDPGIGFGKKPAHNIEIINRLAEFSDLDFPVLVGASRKSFLSYTMTDERATADTNNATLPPPEKRLSATLAAHLAAYLNGARIFRVHDVKEHRDFFQTYLKIADFRREILKG